MNSFRVTTTARFLQCSKCISIQGAIPQGLLSVISVGVVISIYIKLSIVWAGKAISAWSLLHLTDFTGFQRSFQFALPSRRDIPFCHESSKQTASETCSFRTVSWKCFCCSSNLSSQAEDSILSVKRGLASMNKSISLASIAQSRIWKTPGIYPNVQLPHKQAGWLHYSNSTDEFLPLKSLYSLCWFHLSKKINHS